MPLRFRVRIARLFYRSIESTRRFERLQNLPKPQARQANQFDSEPEQRVQPKTRCKPSSSRPNAKGALTTTHTNARTHTRLDSTRLDYADERSCAASMRNAASGRPTAIGSESDCNQRAHLLARSDAELHGSLISKAVTVSKIIISCRRQRKSISTSSSIISRKRAPPANCRPQFGLKLLLLSSALAVRPEGLAPTEPSNPTPSDP